jgi:hypothetical protein
VKKPVEKDIDEFEIDLGKYRWTRNNKLPQKDRIYGFGENPSGTLRPSDILVG